MKTENENASIERLRFENDICRLEFERRDNIFKDSQTKYKNKPSPANRKKVVIAYKKCINARTKWGDALMRFCNATECHTIEESPLKVTFIKELATSEN